jgi:Acyl-CoA thioester hydrolase/BAAT N-terminal region
MSAVRMRHSAECALVDERINTVVDGLLPEQSVIVQTEMTDERDRSFTAKAFFDADSNGTLDLERTPTKLGSDYDGRDCMGLITSMKPAKGVRPGTRFVLHHVISPNRIRFSVRDGNSNSLLATSSFLQTYMGEGVRREVVHTPCGLRGTIFIPAGEGPHKGIIDMFGGGGGLFEFRAAVCIACVYAVFSWSRWPLGGGVFVRCDTLSALSPVNAVLRSDHTHTANTLPPYTNTPYPHIHSCSRPEALWRTRYPTSTTRICRSA